VRIFGSQDLSYVKILYELYRIVARGFFHTLFADFRTTSSDGKTDSSARSYNVGRCRKDGASGLRCEAGNMKSTVR
jgi:hypothetical protein